MIQWSLAAKLKNKTKQQQFITSFFMSVLFCFCLFCHCSLQLKPVSVAFSHAGRPPPSPSNLSGYSESYNDARFICCVRESSAACLISRFHLAASFFHLNCIVTFCCFSSSRILRCQVLFVKGQIVDAIAANTLTDQ